MGLIETSAEIESLARQVKDNGGVYLIPAFVGLGAPYWDPHARGLMIGLTRGTTRAHIARAALESITFQCNDVLRAMMNDAGARLTELRVDGGASENDLMMQFQADISGVPVVRPEVVETTALGAAYLAGLGCGVWKSTEEIEKLWRKGTLILGMNEIAENTGIEIDSLMKLSENEKLNLMYEFAIGTDKNELARMVSER